MTQRPPRIPRRPIGVFDSGVGGLTVLKALRHRLPYRDFVYVGDTARVPYGRKPPEMVTEFALGIGEFLMGLGVDAIVIACNTASAAALPALQQRMRVPVWGVIDPGVDAACRATKTKHVGIIATEGTIQSGAYQVRLRACGVEVWARACPMLVHLVEEGLANSPEAELLIRHYLNDRPSIDTLILGCTHYPLLRGALRYVLGEDVRLVDSAEAMAERVRDELGPVPKFGRVGRITHFVTGDVQAFEHTARVVGAVDGQVVPLPVADLAIRRRAG